MNKKIFNITKNLENFQYNVVVANIYEMYNELDKQIKNKNIPNKIIIEILKTKMILIMPLIPHIASECLKKLDKKILLKNVEWPKYDKNLIEDKESTIIIQIDGKKRGSIHLPLNSEETIVSKKALEINNVKKYLDGKKIIKIIYIKNKIINFIT